MKNINKGTGYLVVFIFWVIMIIMLFGSCTATKDIYDGRTCCEKTAQKVYEYEGLIIKE